MFKKLHQNDGKIKTAVHRLSEGMHLDELKKLLQISDCLEKIEDNDKRIKLFFYQVKNEVKKGFIKTKTIKEIIGIQNDLFKK